MEVLTCTLYNTVLITAKAVNHFYSELHFELVSYSLVMFSTHDSILQDAHKSRTCCLQDCESRTVLHLAVHLANPDVVQQLLCTRAESANEAQVRRELLLARDQCGSTALRIARQKLRVPYRERSLHSRLVELLEQAYDALGLPAEEDVEEDAMSDIETEPSSDMDEDEGTSEEGEGEAMDAEEAVVAASIGTSAVACANLSEQRQENENQLNS